jgi:hypothetical protein
MRYDIGPSQQFDEGDAVAASEQNCDSVRFGRCVEHEGREVIALFDPDG